MFKMFQFLSLIVLTSVGCFAQESEVVEVNFKSSNATTELCGNGVDEDLNGVDSLCTGPDRDNDGFNDSVDCAPENHFVYPGISATCKINGCQKGTQVCQTGGTFSACTCTPLCEAKAGGRCYYVDPVGGNDSNSGTITSKLKTMNRFGYYSVEGSAPSNRIALVPGDVVYLFSGLYNSQINTMGKTRFLALRALRGTAAAPIKIKNYPGEVPTVNVPSPVEGLYVLSDQYLEIEGIIFDGSDQAGIMIADSDNIKVRNVTVRNTKGFDNDNLSGVYLVGATNIDIATSVIYDNYDRVNADTGGSKTENSRNMVIFNGGNVRVHHSAIFQTPPTTATKTGACIVQKHSQNLAGSNLVIDHNTFRNCAFNAIGTGGYNGSFDHNLILDSDIGIRIKDHGGAPNYFNNVAEYNTFINTPPFEYNPSDAALVGTRFDNQTFRYNIVRDNRRYTSQGVATFMVDPYGPNTVYNSVVNGQFLKSNNNCYFSSSDSSMFSFFADNRTNATNIGNFYGLSAWQSLGYDSGSSEVNPNLDVNFIPQHPNCTNKGYSIP